MKALSIALAVLAAFMAVLIYVGSAHSQQPPQCPKSDALDKVLREQFGETVTAGGVMDHGDFMYLTTNPTTHSWSVLVRRPDGTSCLVVGGKGFALADPAPLKGDKL